MLAVLDRDLKARAVDENGKYAGLDFDQVSFKLFAVENDRLARVAVTSGRF